MAEHTPGPWVVQPSYGRIVANIVDGATKTATLAIIPQTSALVDNPGQGLANARLIAAAPEMLAYLKEMEWSASVDDPEGGYNDGCPSCDAAMPGSSGDEEYEGHVDGCALAALIAKAEVQS